VEKKPVIATTKDVKVLPGKLKGNEAADICKSCGAQMQGNYCTVCGEKKLGDHDFKLKNYVEESVEGLFHFDNKFFRSAKLLIFRPGLLSKYFFEGKRVAYMKPFQIFIICNIVFFLLVGKSNLFSLALSNFYNYTPYINFNTREIINAKAATDQQFQLLAARFNEKMGTESKEFLAVFIPVFALGCLMVFHKNRKYLTEHLVFCTHYLSFILIYYTFFMLLVSEPYYRFFSDAVFNSTFDMTSSLITLIIFAVYFWTGVRRFYKASRWRALAGSVLISVIFLVTLYSYRLIMFFKIIHEVTVT
jgi:hypothetical protein